ncbi:MAG: pyruvate kinase [Patescibacteria group bacterium]
MKKRLTKIVATIGPSCESDAEVEKLIELGVNVFRFNLKHNDLDWHRTMIAKVRRAADKVGVNVGVMIDLQGPEIRVSMEAPEVRVEEGTLIPLGQGEVSVSHPEIIPHLPVGQRVLIDDGSLNFRVEIHEGKVYLKSHSTGVIRNKKNFNIPGCDIPVPSLVSRDVEAIKMAAQTGVDFVALSFVRSTKDIDDLKKEMSKHGANAKIIAKIETQKSLHNLKDITREVDGLMVARGDLGVEISLEKVPYFQKQIIREAFQRGVPVITATQMLQSMVENPYPTRAEVSDVANAFYDLTDAVMLSAETATGKYPKKAVSIMGNILEYNESQNYLGDKQSFQFDIKTNADMITESAYNLYLSYQRNRKNLAGFLVFTQTGATARLISRYRPLLPIFTFVSSKQVADSLSIDFGVQTFTHKTIKKNEVTRRDIKSAIDVLRAKQLVKNNDALLVLHGDYWAVTGGTSTLKIIEI